MFASASFFGDDPPAKRRRRQQRLPFTAKATTKATTKSTLVGSTIGGEYVVPLTSLTPQMLVSARSRLTVKPRASAMALPDVDTSFPLYRETATSLHVPVFWGLRQWGKPEQDDRCLGEPISVHFSGDLKDDPPQTAAVASVHAELGQRGGALLILPCGFGKTVCALKLVSDLGRKCLVVVHKEFLMQQWIDRIGEFLPTARVGQIRQKIVDVEGKDIVLGMLQSICMRDYPAELWRQFGAVIFDETHHIAAVRFKEAVRKLPTTYKIGLTATPDRSDGLGGCIPWLLGDVAYRAHRKVGETVCVYKVVYTRGNQKEIKIHYGPLQGRVGYSQMVTRITKDRRRNDLLGLLIQRQVGLGRHLLILTERVAHLETLHRFLKSLFENLEETQPTMAVVKGGDKIDKREAGFRCQVVLSTYQYASEGLDIKRMDTLVLASPAPTAKLEQCVGRILRPCLNKQTPRVFDVVDPFSVFLGTSLKRKKYYLSERYRVVEVDDVDPELLQHVS